MKGQIGNPNETTRRKALIEAIEALYAARRAGEVEDYLSYFAPDARMTVVGNPVLNPDSGLRIGRTSIGQYLERVHDENVYLSYELHQIIAEGDHVIVRQRIEIRLSINGRRAEFEVVDHLRIRNDQIVEITQFFDTGAMALMKGRIKLA